MKDGVAHKEKLCDDSVDGCGNDEDGPNFTLIDMDNVPPPTCPDLLHHIERNDGCGCQYQGKSNAGWVGRTGIHYAEEVQQHRVSLHGKALADPYGFLVKRYLKGSIKSGKPLKSGARNATLYLAQNHPSIRKAVSMKDGVWAPKRLVYIYYRPQLWSKKPVEFAQSMTKQLHYRASMPIEQPVDIVNSLGRITGRRLACPCPHCAVPKCDYSNCVLKS